jgi:hypothetical protein
MTTEYNLRKKFQRNILKGRPIELCNRRPLLKFAGNSLSTVDRVDLAPKAGSWEQRAGFIRGP